MATVNLFGDLSLEATQADVRTAVQTSATAVAERGTVAPANAKGVPLLATRHDSDTIGVAADGDYSMLHTDETGRLKVATQPGGYPVVSGVLTTTAAAATGVTGLGSVGGVGYLAVDVSRVSNVMFSMQNTGTAAMAAGQFAIEASLDSTDGTDGTWISIQAVRSNANTIVTNTGTMTAAAGAGAGFGFEASVNANMWFRLRVTTNVTTNSAAKWTIVRGAYATEPIPAAQTSATQPVSGTVTANTATGTGAKLVTTASTNGANLKTSAGSVFSVIANNPTATAAYLKLYDKASAPTVGTDAPVLVIDLPANSKVNEQFGAIGARFPTGIGRAVTAARADTDTGNAVAGITIIISYV